MSDGAGMDIDQSLDSLIAQQRKKEQREKRTATTGIVTVHNKKFFKNGQHQQNGYSHRGNQHHARGSGVAKRGTNARPIIKYIPYAVPVPQPVMHAMQLQSSPIRMIATSGSSPQRPLQQRAPRTGGEVKVHVSNLLPHVAREDLEELFKEFLFTRIAVHYDEDGAALGSADVFFPDLNEAHRFRQRFSNCILDGKLMGVQLVNPRGGGGTSARGGGRAVRRQPQVQRQSVYAGQRVFQQRDPYQQVIQVPIQIVPAIGRQYNMQQHQNNRNQQPFRGGRGGGQYAYNGRGGGGSGKKFVARQKTAQDLDRELDEYMGTASRQ